jgi:phosphoribosyl-ATP pyrophosphohydrolase
MTEQQFNAITQWQKEVFPQATPISKRHHLQKEIVELVAAIETKLFDRKYEYADCFFLLFGAAAADGLSYEDIIKAIDEKFEINKNRKWGKPDANGVVEHIKDKTLIGKL